MDALSAQEFHSALDHFVTMTILVSGSDKAKLSLDHRMLESKREIEESFEAFSEIRQGDLVQCLLELCTDGLNDESNAIVWDYQTYADCEEFSNFVGNSVRDSPENCQVMIRDIDYSLILGLFDQLTPDNLIAVLQKIRECASCFRNKQTLIKSNFQPFVMA